MTDTETDTETEVEAEAVTIEDMLATGATYRQLDYWARGGYLKPQQVKRGSGRSRTWNSRERDVSALIVRLLAVGVELAVAARVAREAVESGTGRIDLGGGVVISLEPAE